MQQIDWDRIFGKEKEEPTPLFAEIQEEKKESLIDWDRIFGPEEPEPVALKPEPKKPSLIERLKSLVGKAVPSLATLTPETARLFFLGEKKPEPEKKMPTIVAMRPKEKEYFEEEALVEAAERFKPEKFPEGAPIFKDPKVNYYAEKIANRLPLWLMAFAGSPAIIGIFELMNQTKNVIVPLAKKEKYDPMASRMLSELIPEDAPEWFKASAPIGEGAADMILAAIAAKKITYETFKHNYKRVLNRLDEIGWPKDLAGAYRKAFEDAAGDISKFRSLEQEIKTMVKSTKWMKSPTGRMLGRYIEKPPVRPELEPPGVPTKVTPRLMQPARFVATEKGMVVPAELPEAERLRAIYREGEPIEPEIAETKINISPQPDGSVDVTIKKPAKPTAKYPFLPKDAPQIWKDVLDRGGIRAYKDKYLYEEYLENVDRRLRRRTGLPPDEMAADLGFDSDTELYKSLRYKKVEEVMPEWAIEAEREKFELEREREARKPKEVEEKKLVEVEKPERKFPVGFDARGMTTFADLNKWRYMIQSEVDDGWVIEYGHKLGKQGWGRIIDKKEPGKGALVPAKIPKEEALKKEPFQLGIDVEPSGKLFVKEKPEKFITQKDIETILGRAKGRELTPEEIDILGKAGVKFEKRKAPKEVKIAAPEIERVPKEEKLDLIKVSVKTPDGKTEYLGEITADRIKNIRDHARKLGVEGKLEVGQIFKGKWKERISPIEQEKHMKTVLKDVKEKPAEVWKKWEEVEPKEIKTISDKETKYEASSKFDPDDVDKLPFDGAVKGDRGNFLTAAADRNMAKVATQYG